MIKVQENDFDIALELERITRNRTDAGAIVTFTGTVRELTGNQKINKMVLEHYPGMTERELERIESLARKRWDLHDCLVIHRFGALMPGDNIVLVITLSAHRKDAFHAAEFLMDYLKTSAPFWKKETTAGTASWVEAQETDNEARDRWSYREDED
jgi:molybdopterin synthase catalytic subunit